MIPCKFNMVMSPIWWIYATSARGYWKSLSTLLKPSWLNSTKINAPTYKITSECR